MVGCAVLENIIGLASVWLDLGNAMTIPGFARLCFCFALSHCSVSQVVLGQMRAQALNLPDQFIVPAFRGVFSALA